MNRNLRVAMIIQAYHPIIGGAERQLGTIAPLLIERGIDVHVLTRRYEGLAAFERIDGVPVHRLAIPGPMPVASFMFTLNGIRTLHQLGPDVIHAHELLSPTTTAVVAKLLFGTPVVAKVLGGGAMGDVSKLKRNLISSLRVKTILNRVDRFITISQEIGDELVESGIPIERQVNIPNGVDTHRFRPVSAEEKRALRLRLALPEGTLAIYTGRLDEEKNVAFLVSAWKDIRGACPDASLAVIGRGTEFKIIEDMNAESVFLLGSREDVAPYLQSANLFILPSKREGLSNALLEAMACGLPVVASKVGGNCELVKDGLNGYLFPSQDRVGLVAAVGKLLADENLRSSMASEGRRFIQANYCIEKTVDKLVNLYRQVSHATSEPIPID